MDVETRTYLDEMRRSLEAAMRAMNDETRDAVRAMNEETWRHFDIVAEGLRGDIRTVTEGVVANSERIERVATEIRHDMASGSRLLHAAIRTLGESVARRRRGR
jgi:hypothetical protein